MDSFEVNYQMTEDDYINYTKFVFFSNVNPSFVNGFKKYKQFVFSVYLIVSVLVLVYYRLEPISFIAIGIFILLLIFLDYKKIYWNSMARALKKDYKNLYFNEGSTIMNDRVLQVSGEKLTMSRADMTIRKSLSEIIKLSVDEKYVYLIYNTYEGTLVPLKALTQEQKEWFLSHQK